MALLFFGGVMNLYWIAGIATYVLAEKLMPHQRWLSHAAGWGADRAWRGDPGESDVRDAAARSNEGSSLDRRNRHRPNGTSRTGIRQLQLRVIPAPASSTRCRRTAPAGRSASSESTRDISEDPSRRPEDGICREMAACRSPGAGADAADHRRSRRIPISGKALLSIMTGKETDEMATFFAVYTAMCEKGPRSRLFRDQNRCGHEGPLGQMRGRGRRIRAGQPILNPVTGRSTASASCCRTDSEYTQNEVGRGWSESSGAVAFKLEDSYAHWCELHLNQHGVIR